MQDGAKKRPKLEIQPGTVAVVQRMFRMAESGKSILDIARTFNGEGIASPGGKLWSKTVGHNMLNNETYKGTLLWGVTAKDKDPPVRADDAFPAIVSKSQFRRVSELLRSRAPSRAHPRRVASSYLLSGLVKCRSCRRALGGHDAKSGRFSYYVCQSIMKRGKGACKTPRLNARRFEKLVVGQIRSNILTEGNIRDLVRLVDEEMDGVAHEQRKRLESIEGELVEVRRWLDKLYRAIETTDLDITDIAPRIREHREREHKLQDAAREAEATLSERRFRLDDVETIAAFAKDMSAYLQTSELTERRAFIESFVEEIVVGPGEARVRYTVPMPDDSLIPGKKVQEIPLNGSVVSSVNGSPPDLTKSRTFTLRFRLAL